MSGVETFTELDVDERRELLEDLEAVDPGARVRLTWDSNRSRSEISVEGTAREVDTDVPLVIRTDERKGDIVAYVWSLEDKYHSGIVAESTGSRSTRRTPTLGEVLDVEVLGDQEGSA